MVRKAANEPRVLDKIIVAACQLKNEDFQINAIKYLALMDTLVNMNENHCKLINNINMVDAPNNLYCSCCSVSI